MPTRKHNKICIYFWSKQCFLKEDTKKALNIKNLSIALHQNKENNSVLVQCKNKPQWLRKYFKYIHT